MIEKRKHPRRSLVLNCELSLAAGRVRGRTLDLSMGGALLEATHLPRGGDSFLVTLDLGFDLFPVRGQTVRGAWSFDASGLRGHIGVRFLEMTSPKEFRLSRFLKDQTS